MKSAITADVVALLNGYGITLYRTEKNRYVLEKDNKVLTQAVGHSTLWDTDICRIAYHPSTLWYEDNLKLWKYDDITASCDKIGIMDADSLVSTSRMSLDEAISFLVGPACGNYAYISRAGGVYLGGLPNGSKDPIILGKGKDVVALAMDLYRES